MDDGALVLIEIGALLLGIGLLVDVGGVVDGEGRLDDGNDFVTVTTGQTLVQLLGQEGHEGMQHPEGSLQAGVESILC